MSIQSANFSRLLASQVLTKLGDAVASPKTVLAWVFSSTGAPVELLGLLVPIRESGSMIPQFYTAGWIRTLPIRKWIWIAGTLLQGLTVAGIGLTAATLRGAAAGWTILGLIALFSFARSLSSVSSKDVIGKTVSKGKRGQLAGWSASAAGLISIGVGAALVLPEFRNRPPEFYGWMLLFAGGLWWVAAGIYAGVREPAGPKADSPTLTLGDHLRRMSLLRTDPPFRRFVMARALLLGTALAAPFYVVLGRDRIGTDGPLLGAFVIAAGLAGMLSSPIWGRLADRSSRGAMIWAGVGSAAVGSMVFLVDRYHESLATSLWFLPVSYFLLNVAYGGARIGRKTYVVNLAEGNKRTDYVSVSNTTIGMLLLVGGLAGSLSSLFSISAVILILSWLGLAGALMARALPKT